MDKKMVQWKLKDGAPVACTEKLKVLNENMEEIEQILQDALDDAVLMECCEEEFKKILKNFIDSLESKYP